MDLKKRASYKSRLIHEITNSPCCQTIKHLTIFSMRVQGNILLHTHVVTSFDAIIQWDTVVFTMLNKGRYRRKF